MSEIDVHATGVLSELQVLGRVLNPWWMRRRPGPSWLPRHPEADRLRGTAPDWRRHAFARVRRQLLRTARRRNAWHGYHAEPRVCPPVLQRIGTGWTRRRALRSLDRYMTASLAPTGHTEEGAGR
jgi:hypothetical protein